MRAPLAALLGAVLAAPSPAAVRPVPLAARAPAAPVAPLAAPLRSYLPGLENLDAKSAKRFLADPQALAEAKRDEDYPAVMMLAHAALDLRQMTKIYLEAEDLRRALLSRKDMPIYASGETLRAYIDKAELDEEEKARARDAVMEWETLPADARALIAKAGIAEASWTTLELEQRAEAVRAAIQEIEDVALPIGHPGYRDALQRLVERLSPYVAVATEAELMELLLRHERVTERLSQARKSASGAALSALDRIGSMADLGEAGDALDRLLLSQGQKAVDTPLPDRAVLASIARKLSAVVVDAAKGTAAEEVLARALGEIVIDETLVALGGSYLPNQDRLVLSFAELREFLDAKGVSAEQLDADPALLEELALRVAPIVAHETTHRLQALDAKARGLSAGEVETLYAHELEREAFTVQALFVRAWSARHPERAAAIAASSERARESWDADEIEATIKHLPVIYSHVPARLGIRARASTLAIASRVEAKKELAAVESGLAVPAARGADAVEAALNALRQAAGAAAQALKLDGYLGYLDAVDARVEDWARKLAQYTIERKTGP